MKKTIGMLILTVWTTAAVTHAEETDYKVTGLSLGGRGVYFDPKDGDSQWYGGAQVRFYPAAFMGLEASADFREGNFGDNALGKTDITTYPVLGSLLLHLFPHMRLSPFALVGG